MPRPRHVPMRRCVACRRSRPQAELRRLCRDAEGAWQLDGARRAPGRGAWLCADDPACHTEKSLRRTFRAQAPRLAQELAKAAATPGTRSSARSEARQDRELEG